MYVILIYVVFYGLFQLHLSCFFQKAAAAAALLSLKKAGPITFKNKKIKKYEHVSQCIVKPKNKAEKNV